MEIIGKIILIGEIETFGAKGFKKRQVVIETESKYPQTIPVDFTQDKTNLLNLYNLGDFVNISINVRGTKWNEKFYVNLDGWLINKVDSEKTSLSFMPDREKIMETNGKLEKIDIPDYELYEDDLPF